MREYEPKWTSVFLGVGFFGLTTVVAVILAIVKDGGVPMYPFGMRVFFWILAGFSLMFVFAAAFMAFSLLKDKRGAEAYEGPGKQQAALVDEYGTEAYEGLGKRRSVWLWTGRVLLSISSLYWLIIALFLLGEPGLAGYTILGAAIYSVIPIAIGIYAVRRGRRPQAMGDRPLPSGHTVPDSSDQTLNVSSSAENETIDIGRMEDQRGAEVYEGPGKQQAASSYVEGRRHLWGDYEKAVTAFTDVIRGGYALGYKYRAVAYEGLGKQQEADADLARFATLTKLADKRPRFTGPKPDRSDQTPNFSRTEENEAIDLSWGEGFLSDGRPYRVEHWAESQVTMLTFFFSTAGMKNYSEEMFIELLSKEGLIEFISDDPSVETMLTTDASGNDMWSLNVVIGTEDEIHARDLVPLRRHERSTT